tara:strand:+ start:521 stop:1717 length:1197 start_codon:yes stop_codon:yes gene_type:complete
MGDSGGPSESQAGDDPSTFDDEGVGYGNINTTTEQALSDDPSIDSDFSAADAAAARAEIQNQQEAQAQVDSFQQMQNREEQEKVAQQQNFAQDMANLARQSLQDTIEEEKGIAEELTDVKASDLNVPIDALGLFALPNARSTAPTTFTQGSIFDVDDFRKATDDRDIAKKDDIQKTTLADMLNVAPNVKEMMKDQTDTSDFNMTGKDVKSTADLRERAKGSLSPGMQALLPFGGFINSLTGLPARSTLNALNRGEVPDFQNMKDGQIQGTTGEGFGANQTEGYIGGLSINAPGAPGGLNTSPIVNFTETTDTDDGDSDQTQTKMVQPKAPTDPCPEGYQLIDGKCTPIAEAATGTGFQVFPANRNPAYRTGPFSPATVATGAGGIRGLNPITFNPFNK